MKPVKNLLLLWALHCSLHVCAQKVVSEAPCQKQHMGYAYNEFTDVPFPGAPDIPDGLAILVLPKRVGFVSPMESYYRAQAVSLDTTVFYLMFPKWKQLSASGKLKLMEQQKLLYLTRADSLHNLSAAAKQLVYVINNTNNEIKIGVQDFSFICILEAIDNNDQWKPVQYWRYSKCGNSYVTKHILPKKALAFIADNANIGNYKTMLRYKLLGPDKFYYSNEFEGSIDYCLFTEDEYSKGAYKLDTFQSRTFSFGDR